MREKEYGSTENVRAMYEAYPYPSPTIGRTLIEDVAHSFYSVFADHDLANCRILDAGCGTGQRLLAVARSYPKAHFVGLDMTEASIAIARKLAVTNQITNVEFICSNILEFEHDSLFDIIVSIGVVHHLENPCLGLKSLASHLTERGCLMLWLYHCLGEHQRLLDREMVLTLLRPEESFEQRLQILREMGLKLETNRYGSTAMQAKGELSQFSIDVDAYLHPIVNAYRFEEAMRMIRGCAGFDWSAINNINLVGTSKLIDLKELEAGDMRYFCQSVDDLFPAESLRSRFRGLGSLEKLRMIENRLKPTGFTILSGRGAVPEELASRVRANVILY